MKTKIDIITGFLDAGKTTFINKLLREKSKLYKKVMVLQCEVGEVEVKNDGLDNVLHLVGGMKKNYELEDYESILNAHAPDYIMIECNGMQPPSQLIDLLNGKRLIKRVEVDKVYQVIESSTFELYMKNFGGLITDQTDSSTDIILNRLERIKESERDDLLTALITQNADAEIYEYRDHADKLIKIETEIYEDRNQKSAKQVINFYLSCALSLVILSMLMYMRFVSLDASTFQVFLTVFISILVQATPFILLGVVVSSTIQILISEQTITRLFPKNSLVGMAAGVVLGAAFPVCDCAVVPVASRLIRKGVPIPAAITFMFASPIVNPVVIAATYYAFPNDHRVVILRVVLGIFIAMLVGAVFIVLPEAKDKIVSDRIKESACACGYCNSNAKEKGLFNKITLILRHSGIEFVQTIKYLIIGAFLSSVAQFAISQETLTRFGHSQSVLPLIVMILAAFVLSICSTSDAFIARTFVGKFTMTPILGFLVLGPMIDIKNLMMLFGNFKSRFVIKLVISLVTISFLMLSIVNIFLA